MFDVEWGTYRTDVRSQRTEISECQRSEVRGQRSVTARDQKSEDRDQLLPEIRGQIFGKNLLGFFSVEPSISPTSERWER